MNNRKIKLIAYIYIHFSLSLVENHKGGHIYKQTKNLHTVGVQTPERRRRLQRPIRLARFMFFTSSLDYVTSRDTNVVHGSKNTAGHLMVHQRRFPELVGYSAPRDLHRQAAYSVCESWFLIHQDIYHDLFVCS